MHLADGNVNVERSVLPAGVPGVDATVARMATMAHGKWGSKSAKIRALAINAIQAKKVPSKDYYGEIVAIHNWVRDNIRYVKDPIGQETLSYPEETAFNSKAGDCDDQSILEMAMLGAVGHRSYPVVVGVKPGQFSHVYVHAFVPPGNHRNAGALVPLDPIMKNWPAGKEASKVKEKKIYPHLADVAASINGSTAMNDLGDYATGPSYLDQENSQVNKLLVPDRIDVRRDNTIANSTQVIQKGEGMDAMMFGIGANDQCGVVDNEGKKDFYIQADPPMRVLMNQDPATAKKLYALGPMENYGARRSLDMAQRNGGPIKLTQAPGVQSVVGTKRYEVNSVEKALRAKRGLMPHDPRLLRGPKIVNLSPNKNRKVMRVVNQPLSADDLELGGLVGRIKAIIAGKRRKNPIRAAAVSNQIPGLSGPHGHHHGGGRGRGRGYGGGYAYPVFYDASESTYVPPPDLKDKLLEELKRLQALDSRAMTIPQKIATKARIKDLQGHLLSYSGINGLGDFMDTIKSPYVIIPAVALVGILTWKVMRGRRRR